MLWSICISAVHKIALQIFNKWVHNISVFKDSYCYKLRHSFSSLEYEDKYDLIWEAIVSCFAINNSFYEWEKESRISF